MIFNNWAIVYGTDDTLGIAETIIGGFCFPLLDLKEWNTFFRNPGILQFPITAYIK